MRNTRIPLANRLEKLVEWTNIPAADMPIADYYNTIAELREKDAPEFKKVCGHIVEIIGRDRTSHGYEQELSEQADRAVLAEIIHHIIYNMNMGVSDTSVSQKLLYELLIHPFCGLDVTKDI